jgi:broad specificity phosphatase PhoE
MKRIILVRHGSTGLMKSVLCGRMSGVHLNGHGINEAETLAWRLAPGLRASVIFTSPMERAIETAVPLARFLRATIRVMPAFNECDFGDWTGLRFAALDSRRDWQVFNERRCAARAPLGESLFDVHRDIRGIGCRCLHSCRRNPIRSLLLHCNAAAILSSVFGRTCFVPNTRKQQWNPETS